MVKVFTDTQRIHYTTGSGCEMVQYVPENHEVIVRPRVAKDCPTPTDEERLGRLEHIVDMLQRDLGTEVCQRAELECLVKRLDNRIALLEDHVRLLLEQAS